jgi:hypothetical protein
VPRDERPRNEDGLTAQQAEFLEWLVDPQRQGSQSAKARELGLSPPTVVEWKRNIFFRKAWDKKLAELNVSPERTQNVMEAAYAEAIKGNVKAMELYMRLVDRISPNRVVVEEKRPVSEMSDGELAAKAREHLLLLEGGGSG